MPTIKEILIINQKKFPITVLAPKKVFVIYMTYLGSKILINLVYKAQIILLLVKKISVPKNYTLFLDNVFKEFVAVFLNHLNINKYIIDLESDKQLPYKPVYNLSPVMLENSKIYITTNLTNRFI